MKNIRPRLNLDKISESSSPEAVSKQAVSPLRTTRGRVIIGGIGDSYLSFFKMENQIDSLSSKPSWDGNKTLQSKTTVAEKDQIIQNLQQSIMKQNVKKNDREKCFQERLAMDWHQSVGSFVRSLLRICVQMCKNDKQHKRAALKILHQACRTTGETKKTMLAVLAWILQWLQPVFKMLHSTIRKKYC